jgi:aerobic-type carbon monoxide dehydrogenase small subunit (CoxS/CutS family)
MTEYRTISFTLNGRPVSAQVAPHHTVVELLQNEFGLFGARESCAQGLCGCCTVNVDGETVSGCLYLAAFLDGTELQTIEGLGSREGLHPIQEAFVEAGASQCGFCTPGFIMMTERLIAEHPEPDEETIRDYLTGNLCRCGTYPQIVEAVQAAARRMSGTGKADA